MGNPMSTVNDAAKKSAASMERLSRSMDATMKEALKTAECLSNNLSNAVVDFNNNINDNLTDLNETGRFMVKNVDNGIKDFHSTFETLKNIVDKHSTRAIDAVDDQMTEANANARRAITAFQHVSANFNQSLNAMKDVLANETLIFNNTIDRTSSAFDSNTRLAISLAEKSANDFNATVANLVEAVNHFGERLVVAAERIANSFDEHLRNAVRGFLVLVLLVVLFLVSYVIRELRSTGHAHYLHAEHAAIQLFFVLTQFLAYIVSWSGLLMAMEMYSQSGKSYEDDIKMKRSSELGERLIFACSSILTAFVFVNFLFPVSFMYSVSHCLGSDSNCPRKLQMALVDDALLMFLRVIGLYCGIPVSFSLDGPLHWLAGNALRLQLALIFAVIHARRHHENAIRLSKAFLIAMFFLFLMQDFIPRPVELYDRLFFS